MNLKELHGQVKAKVWQALAQGELNLSELPREKLEALVSLVADTAILEVDAYLGKSVAEGQLNAGKTANDDAYMKEEILWEGRPLLSISMRYVITNERVRAISGLVGKSYEDVELIRIQDVDISQKIGERMLNVGDVTIRSHDS